MTAKNPTTRRTAQPGRLDSIPTEYHQYQGYENILTYGQLTQFRLYLDTPHRPAFMRLGASTPQSPAILMRQSYKKLRHLLAEHGQDAKHDPIKLYGLPESEDASHLDVHTLEDMFSRILHEQNNPESAISKWEKKRFGLLDANATRPRESPIRKLLNSAIHQMNNAMAANKKPYSIWAVTIEGQIQVIRRDEDPRVSFRWMKAPNRPWNLNRVLAGT